MENKYENRFYWEKKIKTKKKINLFEHEQITKETVFFHGVILDYHGVNYDEWICFPNMDAMLGFLTYLFIPISFYSLNSQDGKVCIPVDGYLDELIEEIDQSDQFKEILSVDDMQMIHRELNRLWNCKKDILWEELKEFQQLYMHTFNQGFKAFTYFQLFETPLELGQYIVDTYEKDEIMDIQYLERELGLSKEQWLDLCAQTQGNEFMRKRFSHIVPEKLNRLI